MPLPPFFQTSQPSLSHHIYSTQQHHIFGHPHCSIFGCRSLCTMCPSHSIFPISICSDITSTFSLNNPPPLDLSLSLSMAQTSPSPSATSPTSLCIPCQDQSSTQEPTVYLNLMIIVAAMLCALVCALGIHSMLQCVFQCTQRAVMETREWVASRRLNSGLKKKEMVALPTSTYANSSGSPSSSSSSSWSLLLLIYETYKLLELISSVFILHLGFNTFVQLGSSFAILDCFNQLFPIFPLPFILFLHFNNPNSLFYCNSMTESNVIGNWLQI